MPITLTVDITGTTADSVTQGSATFSFGSNYEVGNYEDGPAYIVVPNGTASLTGVTPGQTTEGGNIINGAMKNFAFGDTQAFDERSALSFGTPLSYPATITSGDVVIKAIGNTTAGITAGNGGSTRKGLCDEYAVLFVVSEAPPAGSFAPAALGWSGRSSLTSYEIDVSTFVSGLPSYSDTGQTIVPYDDLIDHIGRYAPLSIAQNSVTFYQEFLPRDFGDETSGGGNFGLEVNRWMNPAFQALISDGYTTEQKETLAKWIISHGIQWGDPLENVTVPTTNGGHYQFHIGCIIAAREATSRSNASIIEDMGINWAGAFQFNAAQIAKLTNHANSGDPFTWRERPVTAVSGNTVTITCTQSISLDPSQVDFRSLTLKRVSDGATALVTGSNSQLGLSTTLIGSNTTTALDLTIDAQPGSPFAVDDVVYFETPWTISEGDFDWTINGPSAFNFYNPSPEAVYRSTNRWTGQVTVIKAAGWLGDFDAAIGYVERANAANDPAGDDFPTHHSTTWEGDFWDQHASTIFA